MKVRIMNVITLTLLFCLLLTAVACSTTNGPTPVDTQKPASSDTNAPEKYTDTTPPAGEDPDTGNTESESDPEIEAGTTIPVYPGNGDLDIELPELQEFSKIILSVKDGKVLGATALDKPADSDIIASYSDFQKLYGYGTIDGINEAFFETHVLRLVHTAQSSGSTRYAVESVTLEDGKLKVEIIEQLAAISTRDIRYWYVFASVDKANTETPVEVNITGIQLAE
ncbi:MAG: hypothetical protein IJW00_06270 [Clostridia bacterium]|nr:hypothetical protein [Clostridia bacterium]